MERQEELRGKLDKRTQLQMYSRCLVYDIKIIAFESVLPISNSNKVRYTVPSLTQSCSNVIYGVVFAIKKNRQRAVRLSFAGDVIFRLVKFVTAVAYMRGILYGFNIIAHNL